MIDLSKVLDRININNLINKIKLSGLPSIFVNIIGYMIKNIYANVKFWKSVGNEWKIGNDAWQGGVLSTLLYSFPVNNVPEKVKDLPVGCVYTCTYDIILI